MTSTFTKLNKLNSKNSKIQALDENTELEVLTQN